MSSVNKMQKTFASALVCALVMAVSAAGQAKTQSAARVIVLLPKLSGITGNEAEWLPDVVKDKIESNVSEYLGFAVVDSSNVAEIKSLQSKSTGDSYNEADVIRIGRLMNANYAFFPKVTKAGKRYMMSVGCTNIQTAVRSASVMSKGRDTVEALFDEQGCAVDEITLALCGQLKVGLTEAQKTALNPAISAAQERDGGVAASAVSAASAKTANAQSTERVAVQGSKAAPKKDAKEIRADVMRRIAEQDSKTHKVYDKPSDFTYKINDAMDGVIIQYITELTPAYKRKLSYEARAELDKYKSYSVIIPDEIEEMPVVGVTDDSHLFNGRCVFVILCDHITELPYRLFNGCERLEEVALPAYITKIGGNMFDSCKSLKSIVLPDAVTEIEDGQTSSTTGAFTYCKSLESIILPPSLTKIGDYTFKGCTALKSIVLPSSLTEIGVNAFEKCTSIENIMFPPSVKSIGWYAFQGCNSLKNVILTDGIQIDFTFLCTSFDDCPNLTMKSKLALKKAGYKGF